MSYKISDRNFILNHGKQYKILAVREAAGKITSVWSWRS
jgi:hypothetical protein